MAMAPRAYALRSRRTCALFAIFITLFSLPCSRAQISTEPTPPYAQAGGGQPTPWQPGQRPPWLEGTPFPERNGSQPDPLGGHLPWEEGRGQNLGYQPVPGSQAAEGGVEPNATAPGGIPQDQQWGDPEGPPSPPPYQPLPFAEPPPAANASASLEDVGVVGSVVGDELPTTCGLTDYIRESKPCIGGKREVKYVKVRNCTDTFPPMTMRDEPCVCSPEDYEPKYAENGGQCYLTYIGENCNSAGDSGLPQIIVDPVYCSISSSRACREGDLKSIYGLCDYIRDSVTGQKLSKMPAVEVIYYFDKECNPYARGAVPLPPNTFIPCDHRCGAGHILHHDDCQECPAGTYSTAGALVFNKFFDVDPKYFKTDCQFKNATGMFPCEPWYADDGALEVGAFDYMNDWNPDVCASDPAYNCHNNLRSSLSLEVDLVRDGHVRFNFTVSAELGRDGLSFFIDSLSEPAMALESYQFEPREVVFPLTAGHHTLMWLYSKDARWTKGEDIATLRFIEVDGIGFNDFVCTPCEAGFYSSAGASSCLPCAPNTVSSAGASVCKPCAAEQYAQIIPRTQCLDRPTCRVDRDATSVIGPCKLSTLTRTKSWEWLEPQICKPSDLDRLPASIELPCEHCPSGQQAVPIPETNEVRCDWCPTGTARDANQDTTPPAEGAPAGTEGAEGSPAAAAGGSSGSGNITEELCRPCDAGEVAMKMLSLRHFRMDKGRLPDGFRTGCHGDCGTFGWRAVNNYLESGSGHGKTATIWLALDVDVAVTGYVMFNYSVDIAAGDPGRGFFFFVDHNLMDFVEQQRVEWQGGAGQPRKGTSENETAISGMWELAPGNHTLMWVWEKLNDERAGKRTTRDSAIIYDIEVEGVARGGAERCRRVPPGMQMSEDGQTWTPCPAGTFSEGGEGKCTPCPANTFNPFPEGAEYSCERCGAGTTSLPGSTECFVGDVRVPSSFCSFAVRVPVAYNGSDAPPPPSALASLDPFFTAPAPPPPVGPTGEMQQEEQFWNNTLAEGGGMVVAGGGLTGATAGGGRLFFDLSPLARLHPGVLFGPIANDAAVKNSTQQASYFISICDRDTTNDTCYDYGGNPLNTYACKVDPAEEVEGHLRPGHNLGESLAIESLDVIAGELRTRGFVMMLKGDGCPQTQLPRQTNITFICDPAAGHGQPEQWTAGGRMAAFDPHLGYPEWAQREGPVQAVEAAPCEFNLVWYSLFACPLCSEQDIVKVEAAGCNDNKRTTYKYRHPRVCQPNPMTPLPDDVMCEPCTANDYDRFEGECADDDGKHNVTYLWHQPMLCNESLPGSVQLPPDEAAGECTYKIKYVPSDKLSWQYIVVFAVSGVMIVVFGVMALMTWLKSRKLHAMYSRLVEQEMHAVEEEMDDMDGENDGATEGKRLTDSNDDDV
ncbi:hypothetical protein CLOM_g6844 [Closterium sp. NIES-68]|nr:hypothetical protein CLOM_g6844 [Closterium sp. NIES-68]GJP72379.1 hypothetical protein CLOP_g3118 [Closterium sp. NIES-67]